MLKITFRTLIAASATLSAVVTFTADANAGSSSHGAGYSRSPAMVMPNQGGFGVRQLDLNQFDSFNNRRTRPSAAPAQGAGDKPSSSDLMAGICNGAGGGASTGGDGKVHCIDPDGNEVLDPQPAPRPD